MGLLFTKLYYGSAPSVVQPGFDEQFDPPLNNGLKCCRCRLGLRDPVQTHCGHRFCKGCIEDSIRCSGRTCPVSGCGHCLGNSELYPDNFAKKEILSWHVCCSHNCTWKGPLRDLQHHLETTCLFISVTCDCGCKILRRDLERHVATGCPRTKDWRLEDATGRQAGGDEASQLPYPTEELGSSSSAEQITGIRRPVEHHQAKESTSNGMHSEKAVGQNSESQQGQLQMHRREDVNSTDGSAPPDKLKNPLSHEKDQGKKTLPHHEEAGNNGKGLDLSANPKEPLLYQEEDDNEAKVLNTPVQKPKEPLGEPSATPEEPLVCQKEDSSKTNGLDPHAKPNQPLLYHKEESIGADGLDPLANPKDPLPCQEDDGIHAKGLNASVQKPKEPLMDPPATPEEPLVHQKEDGTKVNGLDPHVKPNQPLLYQEEKSNEAIGFDPLANPQEPLLCQERDGIEAKGLNTPAQKPKEPLVEPKEPLLCQEEDGIKAKGLNEPVLKPKEPLVEPSAAPEEPLLQQKEDDTEANRLDPPAKPKEVLVQGNEDGSKGNELDPPANKPLLYQEEDDIKANWLAGPVKKPKGPLVKLAATPAEPLVHQKEDADEANRLDPPDKPNKSLVYQMEDGNKANGLDPPANLEQLLALQKEDGNEGNGLNQPVKSIVPLPCQGEDARELVVSSQNHVPSFI